MKRQKILIALSLGKIPTIYFYIYKKELLFNQYETKHQKIFIKGLDLTKQKSKDFMFLAYKGYEK